MLTHGHAAAAPALASSLKSSAAADNYALSVKRVPGYLTGWKMDKLASPYDLANESGADQQRDGRLLEGHARQARHGAADPRTGRW